MNKYISQELAKYNISRIIRWLLLSILTKQSPFLIRSLRLYYVQKRCQTQMFIQILSNPHILKEGKSLRRWKNKQMMNDQERNVSDYASKRGRTAALSRWEMDNMKWIMESITNPFIPNISRDAPHISQPIWNVCESWVPPVSPVCNSTCCSL